MLKNFAEATNFLKEQNLYRRLISSDLIAPLKIKRENKKLISFASNDYFSLAQERSVKKAAINAIKKYGVGATASRFVCGNNSLYEKLEKQIAKIHNCQDAIVFTSGYQAAIGIIPALVGEGDLIIADKLIHSCLLDGARLSKAKLLRFIHNDLRHAQELIKSHQSQFNRILIISEIIFSMDGDKGKINELEEIAQKYNCLLLTDAAHSLFEKNSKKTPPFHLKMGTLSKAVGSLGGYVAGEETIIDYLRNHSKSLIYTTALPPSVLAASLQALTIIEKKDLIKQTLQNAHYFCQLMNMNLSESAIVIIKIGDNEKVLKIANAIAKKGMLISAIRPPTVEANGARLRITFSVKHNKRQIKKLANLLKKEL